MATEKGSTAVGAGVKEGLSPEDHLVSKLVTDPAEPPELVLLFGYWGASSEKGHRRLYLDPCCAHFLEIPADAVVHTQHALKEHAPFGGAYVWLTRAGFAQSRYGNPWLRHMFAQWPFYSGASQR